MSERQHQPGPGHRVGPEQVPSADYIRFAVLGDSASCGVGDPTPDGWRGWARILSDAIAVDHHISFCNLAVPGAAASDVLRRQLGPALAHRPVLASLVVGLNDVMRSTWDPDRIRADVLVCARELARQGAFLVTVRFHDHTRVLGVPKVMARPLRRRIDTLNAIYDELHEKHGGLRIDLTILPDIYERDSWSFDRLHPSELGHRRLARQVAALLNDEGLAFPAPSLACTGTAPTRREQARTLFVDIAPWLGRRIRDLAPCAVQGAVDHLHGRQRRAAQDR